MIIEIFGKDFCPYCDKAVRVAQQFIQETEHKYEYFKLDKDFTREELFSQFPGARTFPQIRVKQNHIEDGEIIGGYTEFESWLENR
jgi:glutaredoxin